MLIGLGTGGPFFQESSASRYLPGHPAASVNSRPERVPHRWIDLRATRRRGVMRTRGIVRGKRRSYLGNDGSFGIEQRRAGAGNRPEPPGRSSGQMRPRRDRGRPGRAGCRGDTAPTRAGHDSLDCTATGARRGLCPDRENSRFPSGISGSEMAERAVITSPQVRHAHITVPAEDRGSGPGTATRSSHLETARRSSPVRY